MAQKVFLTGNQTFVGNPPNDDFIITDNGVGSNTITIGNGTDQLTLGAGGKNTMTLGDGTDQITAGGASNTITTGNGNSHITVGNGSNTITVGTGSNTIVLGMTVGTGDTVHTGAGNNLVFASAANVSGDTIMGALTSLDGTTNRLVLTTAGTMSPVSVSGFQSYQLANGGLNSLTLSETNFARLPGGSISVIGGDSGNTVIAGSLAAGHGVVITGGAGTDKFTGGSGNDRFVFTPSSIGPNDTADGGAGNNTLELTAGGSGVLKGLGTSFVNISRVLLDANAVWTIGISNPAAFTGMISGLTPGDTLDLPFMSFSSSGTATLASGNVLQISENGSTVAIKLDPNQSFAGDSFQLAPDSGGGTRVFEIVGTAGTGFTAPQLWMKHGGNFIPGEAQYADVNGDGKADLIMQGLDNNFYVSLSTGAGFTGAQSWMKHGGDFIPGEAQYVDLNGDRKADLIMQGLDNNFWVSLSTGTGFTGAQSWIKHSGSFVPGEAQYADLNGDGKTDLIMQGLDNAFWASLSTGNPPPMQGALTANDGASGMVTQPAPSGTNLSGVQTDPVANGAADFNVTSVPSGDLVLTAQTAPETFDFGGWVFGNDEIAGFDPTQDAIRLSSGLASDFASVQADTSAIAGGTLITFDASHSLTLDGVAPGSLGAANFRFT